MPSDLKQGLSHRLYNARLQQKICCVHGRNPNSFRGASRLQSTGRDAVVNSQDDVGAKRQNIELEPAIERDSSVEFTRRDLIRGLVAGTVVTNTPALLPASQAPVAEAIPATSRLPPIGQAAPGTNSIGVAAVRDPGLYRLVQYNAITQVMCAVL